MVVYLHVAPMFLVKEANPTYFWIHRTVTTICQCAVPAFFLISGYLLCFNIQKLTLGIYLSKLGKRVKTLFIPYILWNLIAVGYQLATHQISELPSFPEIFISPINFPLWFIRNLFILVIIFPLIYGIARYLGKYGLIAAIVCFIWAFNVHYFFSLVLQSIFFFYLGIYGGVHKVNVDSIHKAVRIALPIIALLLFISVVFCPEYIPQPLLAIHLYLLAGTLSLIIICNQIIAHWQFTLPTLLTSSTFFIYVAHKIGATYTAKQIVNIIPMPDKLNEIVTFLVSPLLAVVLCVGVYMLLSKYSPKTFKILTGGK